MKNRKIESFVYKGLGLPIKLINVPMKKVLGEWVIDIDMNKLQLSVLKTLIYKPIPLNGSELKFIRKFLQMSLTEFGKILGVSHVAVLKWENGERNISRSMEVCLRLAVLEHLHAKDREFRNLYNKISLEMLSKRRKEKIHPLEVDVMDDLKIAL